MKVGSLFSGIGGLDLGLERAGMEIVWQVENDPYCQKVLKKHWPGVPCYGDIKEIDFTTLPPVDLICGGFPCQPVSCAGKRQGDQDARWLWPEFYRAVCEARPQWVLVENVPGLLSAQDGRLFGGILRDLACGGYDAEWDLLPAAAFGAPHLRYRVFLVAHAGFKYGNRGEDFCAGNGDGNREGLENGQEKVRSFKCGHKVLAHAPFGQDLIGRPGSLGEEATSRESGDPAFGHGGEDVADSQGDCLGTGLCPPGAGRKRWGRLGDSDWWATEPDVGRVAHGIPARVDRLKCLGNAVVPQVAEWIGRRIMGEPWA